MNVREYYKHNRSLGNFRAQDCLMLAREAAALDAAAAERANASRPGPSQVSWETLPDGSAPARFNPPIYVF